MDIKYVYDRNAPKPKEYIYCNKQPKRIFDKLDIEQFELGIANHQECFTKDDFKTVFSNASSCFDTLKEYHDCHPNKPGIGSHEYLLKNIDLIFKVCINSGMFVPFEKYKDIEKEMDHITLESK